MNTLKIYIILSFTFLVSSCKKSPLVEQKFNGKGVLIEESWLTNDSTRINKYSDSLGILLSVQYNDTSGKSEGIQSFYYPNGNLKAILSAKNNEIHGLQEEYFQNGVTRFSFYQINDTTRENYKQYLPDGKIFAEYDIMINDRGWMRFYDSLGNVKAKILYDRDKIIDSIIYNPAYRYVP